MQLESNESNGMVVCVQLAHHLAVGAQHNHLAVAVTHANQHFTVALVCRQRTNWSGRIQKRSQVA